MSASEPVSSAGAEEGEGDSRTAAGVSAFSTPLSDP